FRTSLRINKKQGTVTKKYSITHRKDYWQLSIFSLPKVQTFLGQLSPRHPEKIARMKIAMSVGTRDPYSLHQDSIISLRQRIKQNVADFVRKAELDYLAGHPK